MMFAPFHSRTQSCPCFIFGLRNKAPAGAGRAGCAAEYGFSSLLLPAHDTRRVYRAYKALLRRRAHASAAILLLRANNERFENNLIDRRPPVRVHPSTFDLFSKTLAEIILRRRRARARARFRPNTPSSSLRLSISHPPPPGVRFASSPPHPVLRLMQSESVGLSSSLLPPPRAPASSVPLLGHLLARGHEARGWRNFRRVSIRT